MELRTLLRALPGGWSGRLWDRGHVVRIYLTFDGKDSGYIDGGDIAGTTACPNVLEQRRAEVVATLAGLRVPHAPLTAPPAMPTICSECGYRPCRCPGGSNAD